MWKPTADTAALTRAMDKKSDCLLFDMCSDALLESGSGVSLWDWCWLNPCFNSNNYNEFAFMFGCGEFYWNFITEPSVPMAWHWDAKGDGLNMRSLLGNGDVYYDPWLRK